MKAITVAAVMSMLAGAASAQTLDDLKNDGKNPDNILTYGMGYSLNRYSPLKQIDKATVKRLVPIWNLSLDNPWGEQAQPLVLQRGDVRDQRQGNGRDRRRHRQADLENAG